MKAYRWFIVFTVLALMLGVGALSVGAAGTDPTGAPYVDNVTKVVGPNGTVWYRFEYGGEHSQITIRIPDAVVSDIDRGLSFQVYTPSQIEDWWNNDGVGAGSIKENDLLWTGNSHEAGTWWIKVDNSNVTSEPFDLIVTGSKVSFSQPTGPVTGITLPTTPELVQAAVPDLALPVKSDAQVLPAESTTWYHFPYSGGHDQINLKVLNGANEHLRVFVYTPDQVKKWWSNDPVGQATAKDSDLVWSGNAPDEGIWYVKVVNDNSYAVNLQMLLSILDRNKR